MAYLVGTDEAGYGPNLGPLVISASVWKVDSLRHIDLFSRLRDVICRPHEVACEDGVRVGDSKELYKPGQGLAGLEEGVLTFLATLKKKPRSWKKIWDVLASEDSGNLVHLPWYREFDDRLPVEITLKDVNRRADRLLTTCRQVGCIPTQIASRVVCPPDFNELCEQYGNKAAALSQTTLRLVRHVVDKLPQGEPVYILCDKHGGRNKYGPLLNDVFPEKLAMVQKESRTESTYQLGNGKERREIVFRAKADSVFLPSALASMVSKYLRELAMRAFNDFWAAHVTGLRPTAGYPMDAKRFKKEIEPTQRALGIADHMLWRNR